MSKKHVTVLCIAGTLMFSSVQVCNAEVPNSSSQAIERLYELGIVNGYEDGKFKPEQKITRAETAAMVRRMMNPSNETGRIGGYDFTDDGTLEELGEDYWAIDEISLLQHMKIITGYEDGTIRPENNVTYNECIKILLCMLGYDYEAQQKGGWSKGYIKCAEEIGLLKGISETDYSLYAPRGDVAIMINNALTTDRKLISEIDVGKTINGEIGRGSVEKIIVNKTVPGITFETILTNKDLYVENKTDTEADGVFKDEVLRVPDSPIIEYSDTHQCIFTAEGEPGSITLHFDKINKACDYYIDLRPVFNSKYNGEVTAEDWEENHFVYADRTYRKILDIGPISTDTFTLSNIPQGSYDIRISSAPCCSDVEASIILGGTMFAEK